MHLSYGIQVLIWSFTMPFLMVGVPYLFHVCSGEKSTKHNKRAIVSILRNIAVSIPFLVGYTDYVIQKGWVDFNSLSSLRFVVETLYVLFLTDTWFYFWHRLLHTPFMYQFHKVHHSYNPTITLAYTAMTPLEFILENTVYFMAPPMLGTPFPGVKNIHLYAWVAANLYVLFWGILIHNNAISISRYLPSILNLPLDHQLHHRRGQKNSRFGLLFSFWDRVLGTYFDFKETKNKEQSKQM